MNEKQHAPGVQSRRAGAFHEVQYKGKDFLLGYHQQRVYNLLLSGGFYSAADISIALRLSDPRSAIRDLRHKGVPISDEWCEGEHGRRYKRYFVHGMV